MLRGPSWLPHAAARVRTSNSSSSETTAAAATTEATATDVGADDHDLGDDVHRGHDDHRGDIDDFHLTTTEPPGAVNPPDVEAWWCDAFEAAAGQDPAEFAHGLADDFRHGYTDMPADTLEEGAEQAALVSCDPEYGQAVAEAIVP